MKYFKVSFKYSDDIYCTNLAKAECEEDVYDYYSKYSWVYVEKASDLDIKEAERKGMPTIICE